MQEQILIIGNGGREYAMGLSLAQDKRISHIYFAPGNAATKQLGTNISYQNTKDLLDSIRAHNIKKVIIGPEAPLSEGLSDVLRAEHIAVFGPSKKAAMLESSKAFMKDFVKSANIPTAPYIQSSDYSAICAFIDTMQTPIVVKASGLCAGKGVIIAQSKDEAKSVAKDMLSGKSFGSAGERVVVESYIDGYELSVFAISDGEDFILLPAAQDHKRLLDNDKGVNTGGMGAYAPTPLCDEKLMREIKDSIIAPTFNALKAQDNAFCGVLFAGIMVSAKDGKPYLLEFNVRFGDPECEVLMPLLETPLLDIINATIFGKIKDLTCAFKPLSAVGVVVASKDYPFSSSAPEPIAIKPFDKHLGHIIYAGVSKGENDVLLASGGRVLLSVGVAKDLKTARDNAYKILESVSFSGMQYRQDIASRALGTKI